MSGASFQLPLPGELLLLILEQLPECCLRAAGAVCRRWRDLVENSPPLQYKLYLALAGQLDNPLCELNVGMKLHMLQQYDAAWAYGHLFRSTPDKSMVVPLGALVLDYQCVQGVLALRLTNAARTAQVLHLKRFASPLRGVPEATWSIPIHPRTRLFSMNPYQDLLVLLLEEDPSNPLVLTSASLSNGQGHGWREVLGLVLRCAARGVESVKVKTSGVYLTVLLSGRADPSQSRSEQELTVHNWKDGVKLVDTIMTPGDLGRMTDVELISDTYLARVCIEAGFTSRLDIYELLPEPPPDSLYPIAAYCRFALPPLKADPATKPRISRLHLFTSSGPSYGLSESRPVFTASSSNQVLVLLMDIEHVPDPGSRRKKITVSFTIHVPSVLKHMDAAQAAPGNYLALPWGAWGPQASRALPVDGGYLHDGMDGRGSLPYGSRYVRQSLQPQSSTEVRRDTAASDNEQPEQFTQGGLYSCDFNQAAICTAIARSGVVPTSQSIADFFKDGLPLDAKPISLADGYDYHMRPIPLPSRLQRLFLEEVVTCLPYRERRIDVEVCADDIDLPAGSRLLGKRESVPMVALSEDTLVIQREAHRELLVVQL